MSARALLSTSLLRAAWLAAALCFGIARAHALDFGSGALPVAFEPSKPVALPQPSTIEISGIVDGASPAMIVLRIDDGASKDYNSRMNDERSLPPGP